VPRAADEHRTGLSHNSDNRTQASDHGAT